MKVALGRYDTGDKKNREPVCANKKTRCWDYNQQRVLKFYFNFASNLTRCIQHPVLFASDRGGRLMNRRVAHSCLQHRALT